MFKSVQQRDNERRAKVLANRKAEILANSAAKIKAYDDAAHALETGRDFHQTNPLAALGKYAEAGRVKVNLDPDRLNKIYES